MSAFWFLQSGVSKVYIVHVAHVHLRRIHLLPSLQAQEFFSDAEEAAEGAAGAVKDRTSSSGPHMARPLGKDPIPTNTEDIASWRKAHPQPARPTRETSAGARQTAEGSWESAKGQAREAVEDVKGRSRAAADEVKGKSKETAEDVKSKTKETAEDVKSKTKETADEVKSKADESVDSWMSWFGKCN